MKKYLSIAAIIICIACNQKDPNTFIIEGKIDNYSSGLAYLTYSDFKDSTDIKNGKFVFKGIVKEPVLSKIKIKGHENPIEFYLENSDIVFRGHIDSLNKAIITGSKTENERKDYIKIVNNFDEIFADIEKEYESADSDRKKELEKLYEKADLNLVSAQKQFIKDNPTSYLCIGILQNIDWCFNSATEYNEYLSLLDTSLFRYDDLKKIKTEVSMLERVDIGKTAPDFEINDINGELIKLSDIYPNYKYTLLDFWASTCSPCRKENRHILAAYERYHDKGFGVFGVSTDTKKELWINAIEKDGLTWINTCNLKKWNNNELVKTYSLRQVSANFLLDNSGKIVASNLRGEDLDAKLDELFKNIN